MQRGHQKIALEKPPLPPRMSAGDTAASHANLTEDFITAILLSSKPVWTLPAR